MDILEDFSEKELTIEEKQWAGIAHFSTLAGFIIPILSILAPLIVYWHKGNESDFIKKNAAKAFNFQISLFIVIILSLITMLGLLFLVAIISPFLSFLFWGIYIIALIVLTVICIIATIKVGSAAQRGETVNYPFIFNILS